MKDEDKYTSFFHAKALVKERFNKISGLKIAIMVLLSLI